MVLAFGNQGGLRMCHIYRVGGYVKLAKLWERSRDKALAYHNEYYKKKYKNNLQMKLIDVYIDITGNKHIYHRPEMIRLLCDCKMGRVNCIASQTKGYLAADFEEFCYMYSYVSEFNNGIVFITEDSHYQIDTLYNPERQKEELKKMSEKYISATPKEYELWKKKLTKAMVKYMNIEKGSSNG